MKTLKTFKKVIFLSGSFLCLALLSSCHEQDVTIEVNKDGSGTLTESILLPGEKELAKHEEMIDRDALQSLYDRDLHRELAKGLGEGVEYVRTEKITRGKFSGLKVVYKFADINKLKYRPNKGLYGILDKSVKESPKDLKFAYDGKKLSVTTPHSLASASAEGCLMSLAMIMEAEGKDEVETLLPVVRLKVKMASGILKADAGRVTGDTVSLVDVNMRQFYKRPDKKKLFDRMKDVDLEDRDSFHKAVKGIKEFYFEPKETIVILPKQ